MDYTNFPLRAADLGLNLRDSSDKVKEGFWVRLDNTRPTQEALLSTRQGRALVFTYPGSGVPGAVPVHSIKRLDDTGLLVGVGQALYLNTTAVTGNIFSGNPLTILPWKPEKGSGTWAYVADSSAMVKVRTDGTVYRWGVAPPQHAAGGGIVGTGGLDTTVPGAVGYDWRYTYYSTATGAESNGSPVQATKTTAPSGSGANISVEASTDPQVDTIRLYRRGGTITSTWRLTATGQNLTGTIRDESADSAIATATPLSDENDVPFTTVGLNGDQILAARLPYTAGPFLGKYILAVGDENRPGYLYWTNAGSPDGASSANNVQITAPTEPLIGICMYNGLAFTFSRDNTYALDFGQQGVTFRGRKTTVGKGLAAPWCLAVGPEIYILGRDAIYATDGETPARSITDSGIRPIFRGVAVSNFQPIDFTAPESMRLYYENQDLHFVYKDTEGVRQHLIWNSFYDRWRSASSTLYAPTVVYGDENQTVTRVFIGTDAPALYEISGTTDAGGAIVVNARTGSIDIDLPTTTKEWGNVILDADPNGGTITLTPYLNAEATSLPPIVLTGTGRQKFARTLSDTFSHSIAFDFAWNGVATIYQFSILYRPDKELIRHWEFPPTSHGLTGWQHLRDGYIAARTNADLSLVVEVDGVPYTAAFRSVTNTGGLKKKLYFDMPPVKGKLFRYTLESSADFRHYGEDSEVRVKPWNTALGYQLVSPFRKE